MAPWNVAGNFTDNRTILLPDGTAEERGLRGDLESNHPLREVHERGPYLDWFTPILARLVDVDAVEVRLAFQTMSFVIMHYVLLCDAELEQIVGVGGDVGRQRAEDHVARAALRLVFSG